MIRHILFLLLAIAGLGACGRTAAPAIQTTETTTICTAPTDDAVHLLYFHGKKRCSGCNAIERLTREVVDSLDNDRVILHVIDITEDDGALLAKKYAITWSSLLLVRNEQVENLTEQGFRFARRHPAQFKAELMRHITPMLE